MKKIIKLLVINIIIIISLILIIDYLYFKYDEHKYRIKCEKTGIPFDKHIEYKTYKILNPKDKNTTNIYKSFIEEKLYQDTIYAENKEEEKAPILLFGDSYTWLEAHKELQYQLSQNTNRTVFNFAFWGWGAQHMLYLINNDNLYKVIDEYGKTPQIAVYTYIRNHQMRLTDVLDYYLDIEPYLEYREVNGKLQVKEYNFFHKLLYRLYMYRRYRHERNLKKYHKTSHNQLYKIISESYYELKKHYPDIKFVIFEYYQNKEEDKKEEEMFKKLEDIGIIYISTKDLTQEDLLDKKYTTEDGYHPNSEAWNILCKPLAKKLEDILN